MNMKKSRANTNQSKFDISKPYTLESGFVAAKTKPELPNHQRAYSMNQPRSMDDVLQNNNNVGKKDNKNISSTPKVDKDKKKLKKSSSKKLVSVANQNGFDEYLKSEGY